VLVDFWTYTCVNWLRTLPYLRAWAAKYRNDDLTVIGVHTPEFDFEASIDNVIAQSRRLGVDYPIAVDSGYGVWRAFANHFWPALYIADAAGRIRFHHFGEGEYPMTEMVIQQLLVDGGADGVDQDLVMVEPHGLEVAADWRTLQSPETYVGYRQSTGFAQEGVASFDEPGVYTLPGRLRLNEWGLSGNWVVAGHATARRQETELRTDDALTTRRLRASRIRAGRAFAVDRLRDEAHDAARRDPDGERPLRHS
jgi:thiol-disulfide isomerase/thioredoxin